MALRLVTNRAHAWLLAATKGKVGGRIGGRPVLCGPCRRTHQPAAAQPMGIERVRGHLVLRGGAHRHAAIVSIPANHRVHLDGGQIGLDRNALGGS